MQTRLARCIGYSVIAQRWWGDGVCPLDPSQCHRVTYTIATCSTRETARELMTQSQEHRDRFEPYLQNCRWCGTSCPPIKEVGINLLSKPLYDTPSGSLEPGSLYFSDWYPCSNGRVCFSNWTNCDGRHLHCVLPNGDHWDIDGRASNCTRRDDTTHRCWVRTGDPEKGEPVHVSKDGNTCSAGAGSIIMGNYHGFLHHGILTGC